jgi:hypothetical protein
MRLVAGFSVYSISKIKDFYMTDIPLASHLISPRTGYNHHGLYIGNNTVIHLTRTGIIEAVPMHEFTDGNGYRIQKYHSTFSHQEIIERAKSRLGNSDYSVISNNCEHFINWCLHNSNRSNQVIDVTTLSSGITGIAAKNLITKAPLIAEGSGTLGSGSFSLLSVIPITTAAIAGYGVYKLAKWVRDN